MIYGIALTDFLLYPFVDIIITIIVVIFAVNTWSKGLGSQSDLWDGMGWDGGNTCPGILHFGKQHKKKKNHQERFLSDTSRKRKRQRDEMRP